MASLTVRPAHPEDVALLLELFGGLAEYEHLEHELTGDRGAVARGAVRGAPGGRGADRRARGRAPAIQTPKPRRKPEALGYALFFPTFSSFLASTGMWLEDLFVREEHRGEGVGRALLEAVAARVRERGGERLEWAALDWNEPALGFYRRIGASTMTEWITHRLDGEALARVAAGAEGRR